MTDKLTKSYSFEVKEIGDRILEFTGSTEATDRDGEVVKADGWQLKNYQNNPVVLFGHDYQSLPVAKCIKAWTENGKLKFRDQFPTAEEYDFADTVYKLCKGGYLNTVSVGFIPLESQNGKGDVRKVWTKMELLEHSIVPVPSNPDALVSAREAHVINAKEFKAVKEAIKSPPEAKEVSQDEIKDEIDYLKTLIDKVGLTDENKASLQRISGGDMPVEIKGKSSTIKGIMSAMDAHHEAHNKAYERVMKGLNDICGTDEEEKKVDTNSIIRATIEELVNGGSK